MSKWVARAVLASLALAFSAGCSPSADETTPAAPTPPPTPPNPPPPAAGSDVPASVPAPSADPETQELTRIEKELLPAVTEKARKLRSSERGDGVEFNALRSEAMAALADARTFLNGLLEKDPRHRQANRLWTQLQELYASLKRL